MERGRGSCWQVNIAQHDSRIGEKLTEWNNRKLSHLWTKKASLGRRGAGGRTLGGVGGQGRHGHRTLPWTLPWPQDTALGAPLPQTPHRHSRVLHRLPQGGCDPSTSQPAPPRPLSAQGTPNCSAWGAQDSTSNSPAERHCAGVELPGSGSSQTTWLLITEALCRSLRSGEES